MPVKPKGRHVFAVSSAQKIMKLRTFIRGLVSALQVARSSFEGSMLCGLESVFLADNEKGCRSRTSRRAPVFAVKSEGLDQDVSPSSCQPSWAKCRTYADRMVTWNVPLRCRQVGETFELCEQSRSDVRNKPSLELFRGSAQPYSNVKPPLRPISHHSQG